MNTIKHRIVAIMGATALGLTFASGCGTDLETAPAEIGVDQQAPAPPQPRFQSPDSIDRPKTKTPPYAPDAAPPPSPSADSAPCVFSAEAAERLGRPVCLG